MRLSDSIVLPAELERARVAGELVIFAGAGVSMGPPADLPGFEDLAIAIVGKKIPWVDEYGDRLDTYLGRAEREELDVQTRARRILTTGRPHNPIHEYLAGVFGSPERVRLITTNFDAHFTTACEAVFSGQELPLYYGPALPPGQDFRGVAYLHGALVQPHHDLVLTDRNFAAAYMAEGWAARFLSRVFADRTVLFVGYSMTDPLMRYLLHSIPPAGRWYGFWHEESDGPGPDHAIERITFATSHAGDPFGDLNEALKRWHWYATASVLDHDRELKRYLTHGPPASPVVGDYLRARLETEEGRQTFWRNANDLAWFEWVIDEGLLDGLTDPQDNDPNTTFWGRWCLENFNEGENSRLLEFLRGRPLTLQKGFRLDLHYHLLRADPLPPSSVLRQILVLLLSQPHEDWNRDHDWEWLLEKLWKAGLRHETLSVLRAGTHVHLQPLERLHIAFEAKSDGPRPLANRTQTSIAPSALIGFLRQYGQELTAHFSDALVDIGVARLVEAYELLDLARGEAGGADWVSYGRTAIAPSDQDSIARATDVLIEMIRRVLDHWKEASPDRLAGFANDHQRSDRKLLERLAIYAVANDTRMSADEALRTAVDLGWPRDPWVRPELYLLLASHYGEASEEARAAGLEALREDSWWGAFDEHHAHARFSLSKRLLRHAPDSPATVEFAESEATAHPEWGESDQDGYLSRVHVGWGGGAPSPIEAIRMLDWMPSEALKRVSDELKSAGGSETSHSLLGAVQQAAKTQPDWGAELLVLSLADPGLVSLSEALLWSLREKAPASPGQLAVLGAVVLSEFPAGTERALGSMLNAWASKLGKNADVALLDLLDSAADVLFARAPDVPPAFTGHGWTEVANNHPAGDAVHVWWRVAEARDWVGDQFVLSTDEAEKERWERVVQELGPAGDFGRPILGMATNRLSAGDAPWSAAEIFPHFDPDLLEAHAAQLWDGRLSHPTWSWSVVQAIRPHLERLFARSAELIPFRSEELGDWVGMLVTHPKESEMSVGDLHLFVENATKEARLAFARSLPRHLEVLSAPDRHEVWTLLLGPYWDDRLTNMPLPLSPDEVVCMISWLPALPDVASDVLELLEISPGEELDHANDLIRAWHDGDPFLESHPAESAGLVRFLARRHSINPWMADNAVKVLRSTLTHGAPCEVVKEAAEHLMPLSQEAADLVEELDGTC